MTELAALPGGTSGGASAIAEDGTVAGWSTAKDHQTHATRWAADGSVTALQYLPQGYYAKASGIADDGTIVGTAQRTVGSSYGLFATRWQTDGAGTDLGGFTVTDKPDSEARAAGPGGTAVGMSKNTDGRYSGVRWNSDGSVTDLGRAAGAGPGTLAFATSVNVHGVIAGRSGAVAVRWTPRTTWYLPKVDQHRSSTEAR